MRFLQGRILPLLCICLFLCSMLPVHASAHTTAVPLASQVHTTFDTENGFPSETVYDIAMTSDGLLWFATGNGLVRYDGYDFTLLNRRTEPTFKAMRASVLCAGTDGSLWVGTNGSGLLHYTGGAWTTLTVADGALSDTILDIQQLADGSVAVAVPIGVYLVGADGKPGDAYVLKDHAVLVRDIAGGAQDSIFGVTGDGTVFTLHNGDFSFVTEQLPLSDAFYTAVGACGTRFVLGTEDGKLLLQDTAADGSAYRTIETSLSTVRRITHDAAGNFHIISDSGWGILYADGEYICMEPSGLNGLTAFYCDFQGNYWLGTAQNGAMRRTEGCCQNWNVLRGTPEFSATAVLLDADLLYAGTRTGLQIFREKTGERIENAFTKAAAGQSIHTLYADREGCIWAAGDAWLGCLTSAGAVQVFSVQDGLPRQRINVLLQTENGDLAVGTDDGLCFVRDGKIIYRAGMSDGVLGRITALLQTADGGLLIGTDGNGVFYMYADGSVDAYSTEDGFPAGCVSSIVRDPENSRRIWFSIGSEIVYQDGFQPAIRFTGLPLSGEIADLFFIGDRLWAVTTNGAASVLRTDMFSKRGVLRHETLGRRHGILGAIGAESQNFAAGNLLYLCTVNGLNVVDTTAHQTETPPPRIRFLTAASGRRSFPLQSQTVITGQETDVRFSFSALTYSALNDFTLEYRLVGLETAFTRLEPAAVNQVAYNRLPKGTYTLEVRAVLPNGTVLGDTASVTVVKEASLAEDSAFWWIVTTAAIGLVAVAVLLITAVRRWTLKRRQRRYRDITLQAFSAIANAVDAKDAYTRGHSDRVAKYAVEIARRYGLRPVKIADLYYSALLHDIGKIGIPDRILKKPDSLTPEEYEVIKTHTTIGAGIVKDITAIPHIARGIRDHHERYDGGGYPRGLRGNAISLEGRIIGIADAYDAMASARGYSAPCSPDYIRQEIEAGKGRQFDPKIADILLEMMADGSMEALDTAPQSE